MQIFNKMWSFVKDPAHSGAIIAILTLVIAGSGIAYDWVSSGQLRVMRRTLQLERPWLGTIGYDIRTLGATQPPEGKPVDWSNNHFVGVQLRVQNGGRTPATKLRWHAVLKIGDVYDAVNETAKTPLPTDVVCDQGELGSEYGAGVMLPSPEHFTSFPVYPGADVVKRFDDVFVNTRVGLYLVGCIDYSDSSGKPWYRTKIRYVFVPQEPETIHMTRFGNEAW